MLEGKTHMFSFITWKDEDGNHEDDFADVEFSTEVPTC